MDCYPNDRGLPVFIYCLKFINQATHGRPIVSSCGSPTEGISRFVDFHLRPLVRRIPSYIKDTTDFLLKLQSIDQVPPGTLLVTLDVKSLYSNIPHDEGIAACKAALDNREILQPPTDALIHLMEFVLTKITSPLRMSFTKNNFTFEDEHYLQIQGIYKSKAMGTRMAPSYANLFMAHLEGQILESMDLRPNVWWRFIDDIFLLWSHGEEQLKEFVELINNMHPTIKFTAEWSYRSVSFLGGEN